MKPLVRKGDTGTLTRGGWDPFEGWFEDLFSGFGWPEVTVEGGTTFMPVIDVIEHGDSITVQAEMPGMGGGDIELTVEGDVLTLRGEKRQEGETTEHGYHRVERRYGTFERSVRLPGYVDQEKIDATFKDGVLTVRLPKTEDHRSRRVNIKEG